MIPKSLSPPNPHPHHPTNSKLLILLATLLILSITSLFRNNPSPKQLLQTLQLSPKPLPPQARFHQPPTWRDHHHHHHKQQQQTLPQTRNRVLISALPNATSDGLGHRFTIINLELNAARAMNVTYVHRIPTYGSLSPPEDPLAVERLFGWLGYPYIRDQLLNQSCDAVQYIHPSNCTHSHYSPNCPICTRLKPHAPFKHLVHVPAHLVTCLRRNNRKCRHALRDFANRHDQPDTFFQMTPSLCPSSYRDGNYDDTAPWFRQRYWSYHQHTTSLQPPPPPPPPLHSSVASSSTTKTTSTTSTTRILPFDHQQNRLQIVIHVRRGDIFNYSRTIIPDAVYADVAVAAKKQADIAFRRDVPTTVSIFSEGVPLNASFRCNHNVARMQKVYLNEKAQKISHPNKHWHTIIHRRLRRNDGRDIRVQTFIATDTVSAVHAMACADVFIGSVSGMSQQLISTLARGILLMPGRPGTNATSGTEGQFPSKMKYAFGNGKTVVMKKALRDSIRWLLSAHFDT